MSTIGPVMLIGAGKMGMTLAQGWLNAGLAPSNLVLVDPKPSEATLALAEDYGLTLNAEAVGLHPNVLVIAVKPQIVDPVLEPLRPVVAPQTLIISIAAGIGIAQLSRGLGTDRIVRTMPNTPAQVGKGMTGAVAGSGADNADQKTANLLLTAIGKVAWFESEGDLDAVTAVSGSGPAYVFHLVEALAEAGRRQGLSHIVAMELARETVIGAAALMEADAASATTLRENVTSPNGTTAAALAVLMAEPGLTDLLDRAVAAARKRSEELGQR